MGVQGFGSAHAGVSHPIVSALFRRGAGKGSSQEWQRDSPCPGAVLGLPQARRAEARAGCGKGQGGQSCYRRWPCTDTSLLQRKRVRLATSCTGGCSATVRGWMQAWSILAPTPPRHPHVPGLEQSGAQAPRRVPRCGASQSFPLQPSQCLPDPVSQPRTQPEAPLTCSLHRTAPAADGRRRRRRGAGGEEEEADCPAP